MWGFVIAMVLFGSNDDRGARHVVPGAPMAVIGRHATTAEGVQFAAAGTTFRLRFSGSSFAIDLSDEERDGGYNRFSVRIDGTEVLRFRTMPGVTYYALAANLVEGELHTLELIKDTEGINGWSRISAVYADSLYAPPPRRSKHIEFIGDSITSVYGADVASFPCAASTWFDGHRASDGYAAVLGRQLDAEVMLTSVSGMGIYRNWNTDAPVMTERYSGVWVNWDADQPLWTSDGRFDTDAVVIALGTNDFSAGDGTTPRAAFRPDRMLAGYENLIDQLYATYGTETPILLVGSPIISDAQRTVHEELFGQLTATHDNMTWTGFEGRFTAGCNGHPSLSEQHEMARQLLPAVARLLEGQVPRSGRSE